MARQKRGDVVGLVSGDQAIAVEAAMLIGLDENFIVAFGKATEESDTCGISVGCGNVCLEIGVQKRDQRIGDFGRTDGIVSELIHRRDSQAPCKARYAIKLKWHIDGCRAAVPNSYRAEIGPKRKGAGRDQ